MESHVLIVEDQALIRKGLTALCKSNFPEWIIHEAEDGVEAVSMAREHKPEIILMDYRMPRMDGLKAAAIILGEFPETKIIMVSAEENNEFFFDAAEAKVSGILPKNSSDTELRKAIYQVRHGEFYSTSQVSDKVMRHFYEKKKRRIEPRHAQSSLLSDRELEVLNLIAKGNSAAQIANQLFISRRTVEAHKANIRKKCQVLSTPDLIRFAISKNLISV